MRYLSSEFLWEHSLKLGVCPVSKLPSERSVFGNKCQLAVVKECVLILLMIAKTCSPLCAFGSFALAICLKCQLHVLLSSSQVCPIRHDLAKIKMCLLDLVTYGKKEMLVFKKQVFLKHL